MSSIPGYCLHCGTIFDGRGGIHIENCIGIRVQSCTITCPNCGKTARLVDGTFNASGSTLEVVSGPPITRHIIAQLDRLLRQAAAGEISEEELTRKAAQLHEGVGSAIAYLVIRYPKTLLAVVTLVLLLKACNPSIKLDLNILVDQVIHMTDVPRPSVMAPHHDSPNVNKQ